MRIPDVIRKYNTFLLALVAVVLVNAVGSTLFLRLDLTRGKAYSISRASKKAVASLSEPLTIKVFFTSDLPAPYNTVERYLRDLLAEYAVAGNRYFNYEFYNVSGAGDNASKKNQELAVSYGVEPVQVQVVEQDQIKFQKALMGMVLIHGDMVQTIPSITTTDGLEYKITSAIRKMANKVSAFNSLKDKVEIRAFLSSSLQAVGPAIGITGLADLPGKLQQLVSKLNSRYYGKLSYAWLDPTADRSLGQEAVRENVLSLHWNTFRDPRGRTVRGDTGYAGIVVRHGGHTELIQLFHIQRIPLFGTQYSLAGMDEIEKALTQTVESVVNVNEEIGYLAGHGTLPLYGGGGASYSQQQEGIGNLNRLLSDEYNVRQVDLKKGIPESLPLLIIAGPREPFSDYELYQIDQFLMKGKSLAVFLDPFSETAPRGGGYAFQNQGPSYAPLNTGLEKLLAHYGLKAGRSYVLDESCYRQNVSPLFGGGQQNLYFAPIIKNDGINKHVPYLANIRGLVMLKASPVTVDAQTLKDDGLTVTRLLSSSGKSWELSGPVNLNPLYLRPPSAPGKFKSEPLAYVVKGSFPSYFAGKPVPERPAQQGQKGTKGRKGKKGRSHVESAGTTITKGKPGKIFLIGTSNILKDNIIDGEGKSPNTQFVLNIIDALDGRTDNAIMRTKVQSFNPLKDVNPGVRMFVKTMNIAGLPALVVVGGIFVWFRRRARKRAIQREFA